MTSPTAKELKKWMKVHRVTTAQAAQLLSRSQRSVQEWMNENSPCNMPVGYWVLLRAIVALNDENAEEAMAILSEAMLLRDGV